MAGRDYRDRVCGAGARHRPCGSGLIDSFCDLSVRACRAVGDLSQLFPDPELKSSRFQVQRQIEPGPCAVYMVQQQIDPVEEMSFIAAYIGARILCGELRFKPVIIIAQADGANAASGRRYKQTTQMRIDYGVSYFHTL
jgi:hypothetical protein